MIYAICHRCRERLSDEDNEDGYHPECRKEELAYREETDGEIRCSDCGKGKPFSELRKRKSGYFCSGCIGKALAHEVMGGRGR